MMKQILCSFILVFIVSVSVMPERVPAADSSNSSSDNSAAEGALIGVAIGTVFVVIMAIAAQNTRAKDSEAINKGRKSMPNSLAFDFGIPSEISFTSPELNASNGYAIAIRF
jgi:hypothetical protein